MKSKGIPGTDCEGTYLVRHLMDYADSLLNVANSYVRIDADWPTEVFIDSADITPLRLTGW